MNEVKVSLDRVEYRTKPSDGEIGKISNRIAKADRVRALGDIEDFKVFAKLVGKNGRTFAPATFKDGRKRKESFEQMRLHVLDFDNDTSGKQISFESVKERAKTYNLPISFAYESFNSKDRDRFRVVFLNETPITEVRDAEVVQNALVKIFPECDSGSREINRMYFGGKRDELLFFDDELPTINVVSAVTGMTSYLEDRHTTNYKREVSKFIRENRLATNNRGMPDVSISYDLPIVDRDAQVNGVIKDDEISPNSIIDISIIEGFGEKSSKKYYLIRYEDDTRVSAKKKVSKNHLDFRSKDVPQILSVCKLLREFKDGSRRLSHDELLGLATNLANVETGNNLFLEAFKKNAYADNRIGKFGYWKHQLKKYISGYKPQSCDKFCRYRDSCPHGTNILSTARVKYHQMERIAGYDEILVSLEEAEDDYRKIFYSAVDDPRMIWFIIKAQTALGKTHIYLEFLQNTSKRVLIVVPTNKLKREIGTIRAAELGIELIESPSLREIEDLLPEEVWEHIEFLYASGKSVIPYLNRLIREDHPECAVLFKQYLIELDEFKKYKGHAITTHKRFLTMDVSKYDLVIIDEDILLGSIIQNKIDISVSELEKLKMETTPGARSERRLIRL